MTDTLDMSYHCDGLPHRHIAQAKPEIVYSAALYSQSGWYDINHKLRTGKKLCTKGTEVYEAMNKLARGSVRKVILHRGKTVDTEIAMRDDWIDPAWLSASTSENKAKDFLSYLTETHNTDKYNVYMQLEIPRGIRMLNMPAVLHYGEHDHEGYIDEKEIVLEPGLRYRVVERTEIFGSIRALSLRVRVSKP